MRDEKEWTRIAAYIENNPVKAGLVSRAEDYRWSSANESWAVRIRGIRADRSVGSARTSACATEGQQQQKEEQQEEP